MEDPQTRLTEIQKKKKSNVSDPFVRDKIHDACITEYQFSTAPPKKKKKVSLRPSFVGTITFHNGDEREARFFEFQKSEEVTAKSFFTHTSKLNDESILKAWFVTYCRDRGTWIVCYDRFDQIFGDWLLEKKIKPFGAGYQLLDSWWCDIIRKLLKATRYLHARNLLHMGLTNTQNYVVVNNDIKIIDVGSSFKEVQSKNLSSLVADDFKGLGNMLKEVLKFSPKSTIALEMRAAAERDNFISLFDNYVDKWYKKLIGHPFLMTASERMRCFCTIQHAIETNNLHNAQGFFSDMSKLTEFNNWNTNVNRTPELELMYNYKNVKYNGNVLDLLRFLRNVYAHYIENPQYGAVPTIVTIDKGVTTLYPDFLIKTYNCLHEDFLSSGWPN